jgi:hypothetical protein
VSRRSHDAEGRRLPFFTRRRGGGGGIRCCLAHPHDDRVEAALIFQYFPLISKPEKAYGREASKTKQQQ